MSLRQRLQGALRTALLAGEPFGPDSADAALNAVTDGYFADGVRVSLDFRELFDLARDHYVLDRAALAFQPRGPGHELAAYRGAGESAGGGLLAAAATLGPEARSHVVAVRNSLTETCLKLSQNSNERAEMLAWLSGFHAALDGEVRQKA